MSNSEMSKRKDEWTYDHTYELHIKLHGTKEQQEELRMFYEGKITKMDSDEYLESAHKDSGFDLVCPTSKKIFKGNTNLYDLNVSCALYHVTTRGGKISFPVNTKCIGVQKRPCAFYLYPRSSISKTGLRLANSVGIIDSGYRGHLLAALDCYQKDEEITKGMRLVQICTPDLQPISKVKIVDEHIGETERGSGGFGSTGK
jgi:dUTP pyrophosphatase